MFRFVAAALAGILATISLGFMLMGQGAHDSHHGASAATQPCPVEAMLRVVCAADGASAALVGASGVAASARAGQGAPMGISAQSCLAAVSVLALLVAGMAVRPRPQERAPSVERHLSWLSLFANSPSIA